MFSAASARTALTAAGAAFLLLVVPSTAAQASEIEILDEFLSQYDLSGTAGGQEAGTVTDRCHRDGGTEQTATLPQGGGVGATNALMQQHVEWHGDRGGFLEPSFTSADSDPYGREFLEFHRDLVRTYADWRGANDHGPIPTWDPMDPIPAVYAYDVDAPCLARDSDDPQVPLPTFLTVEGGTDESPFWGYTDLCSIEDNNHLGKVIEGSGYHIQVHEDVGGDMSQSTVTLRDPVFWAWHQYLEGVHKAWEACTVMDTPSESAIEDAGQTTPGPYPLTLFGALGLAALVRRRI